MTAAFVHLTAPAVRGRGARLLCALALAVPIPLFAALGLSLPLPATVERLAAKLVPFAQSDPSDTALRMRGTIILAAGERQTGGSGTTTPAHLGTTRARARESQDRHAAVHPTPAVGPIRTGDEAALEPTADSPKPAAEQVAVTTPSPTAAANPSPTAAPNPNPPSSGGGGTPTGGGTEPAPPPPPAPVVETATQTVNGAVETVTSTATTATDLVVGTAKDALPGGITRP